MLRNHAKSVLIGVLLVDGVVGVLAFLLAYVVRGSLLSDVELQVGFRYYVPVMFLAIPVWLMSCYVGGLYKSRRLTSVTQEVKAIGHAALIATVCCAAVAFAFKFDFVSRVFLLIFNALMLVGVLVQRTAVKVFARSLRRSGYNSRNVVLVGKGATASEIGHVLGGPNPWGLTIVKQLPLSNDVDGAQHLQRLMSDEVVDEVILAMPNELFEIVGNYVAVCEQAGINVHLAMSRSSGTISTARADELAGVPLLTISSLPNAEFSLFAKRAIDVVTALTLLIALAPVLAVVAIAIKFTSDGPVLFRQERVGLNGRPFTLFKFRSMVAGAESLQGSLKHLNEMKGPVFKIQNDPRLTRIGHFLRRTSLDELPQLWNILRGEMSLVGPRPAVPSEVAQYAHWQRRRLSMWPGLTCLWQVSGRNQIGDFDQWMALDLHYIDNWSLTLDMVILAKTVPAVLFGRGAA
jgi:exopolysaccharide biosynthesis polyprenyl glycosylphosphotransferase